MSSAWGDTSYVNVTENSNVTVEEESSVILNSNSFITSIDIASENSSAMAGVIQDVLGAYQRKTYTITEVDSSGNVVGVSTEYVPGLAGLDYQWIAGVILFSIVIIGIFKLLGGLFRS